MNSGRSRRPWCYHKRGISLEHLLDEDSARFLSKEQDMSERDESEERGEGEHLMARIASLVSSEEMADIHFVVGSDPQIRIPAHKLIVSLQSEYFKQLFYCGASGCSPEVQLPEECCGHVFLEILRFLYSEQISICKENAISLNFFAQKFQISTLVHKSRQFIRHAINQNNCYAIWLSARQYAIKEFESLALKVIETNASHVLLSQDFLRSDLSAILELLSNDLLRIKEIQLFTAVTRWAKHKCLLKGLCPTRVNIKHVLCDSLDSIRFPLMSEEELRTRVHNEGLLEEEVFRSLMSSHRTWPRMVKQFSCKPRAQQLLESCHLLTVQRFETFDNHLVNKNTTHCLAFQTNQTIFLNAVGVYGPKRACPFYLQVELSIVRSDRKSDPTIMDRREENALLKCDGSQPILNVKLDTPFEILANEEYEVVASVSASCRPVSVIGSKFNSKEIQFYYGLKPLFQTRVQRENQQPIGFTFRDITPPNTHSLPNTPLPPPRPPPPAEYTRRESRINKLKRALSFSSREVHLQDHVSSGQIPVLTFFA